MINLHNRDCLEAMREMEDNQFDLAICDPGYGIGKDWEKRNKGGEFKNTSYKNECIPDSKYFYQLKRVSKNQIIWGYNYFTEHLGSTNYMICWDKMSNNNDVFKYSKFELAYTSIKIPANLVKIPWDGYRMGKETGIKKIHPHQKPIQLYEWLLINYAKEGNEILDTHAGSFSIGIACHRWNFSLEAYELDTDHYNASLKRFKEQTAQLRIM